MKTLKIVLIIFVILLLIASCGSLWLLYYPKSEGTNKALTKVLIASQANYFCKLAYPQFAGCVKFNMAACPGIVNENITPCIQQAINKFTNSKDAPKESINQAINQCVSKDLQQELLHKYFNNTPECRAKFKGL